MGKEKGQVWLTRWLCRWRLWEGGGKCGASGGRGREAGLELREALEVGMPSAKLPKKKIPPRSIPGMRVPPTGVHSLI